jgi:hypothetical protein
MIEESCEQLPVTQESRNCTIFRFNFEQFDRVEEDKAVEKMWRNEAIFIYSGNDAKQIPVKAVEEIDLSNQKLDRTEVDNILKSIYKNIIHFFQPYPVINIGGENAPPSGDYKASDSSTGMGIIWSMVDEYEWTIIFNEVR